MGSSKLHLRAGILALSALTGFAVSGCGTGIEQARDTVANGSAEPSIEETGAIADGLAAQSRSLPGRSARASGSEEPDGRRPNVLVVALDNVRADRLSGYGGPNPTSGTLDALAARGTRFAYCVAQAPYSPHSWSSLLSSLHVSSLPVRERARAEQMIERAGLEAYHVTLAEAMRDSGYSTAAIVQGWFTDAFGLRQGFDTVDFSRRRLPEVVDRSIEWLRDWAEESRDRPFFLFSYSLDVHAEFMEGRSADAHVFGGDPQGLRYAGSQMQAINRGDLDPTAADLQNALTLYDEGIYWTDRELRPLLEELQELGVADNTIIVVVSDHGEAFEEHGLYSHGLTNHAEEVNVPLIIYDPRPGGAAGNVVDQPVMNIDVMPTILDLVGAPIPAQAQGLSLAPSVRGLEQPELVDRPVFSEGARLGFAGAAIAGGYKLLVSRRGGTFLYDLAEDPRETHNLTEQLPHVTRGLEDLLFLNKMNGAAWQLLLAHQATVDFDSMSLPRVEASGLPQAEEATTVLSEEEAARLRSLGYLR